MEKQVRLTLLQPEGAPSGLDWIGRLTDSLSRLSAVREKVVEVFQFQNNAEWSKQLGDVGYGLSPFTGAVSIYSSDVDSLKKLVSTFLEENEIKDPPPVWFVGYDEVKMNKAPKDPSKPLAKFVGLLKRNPNFTVAQFHSYWSGPHAALFCSLPYSQEKAVIYKQFHTSPEWTEDFAKLGLKMGEQEGVVELWFQSIEEIVSFFAVPENMGELMADHAVFMNEKESGVMIGVDA